MYTTFMTFLFLSVTEFFYTLKCIKHFFKVKNPFKKLVKLVKEYLLSLYFF